MIVRRTPLKRSTKPIARRKRVKAKRATPRRGPLRDPGYLAFLREEGKCIACTQALKELDAAGFTADGWERRAPSIIIDPAHGPVNGRGSKGPDHEAVPLCRVHHSAQHDLGWRAFETKYNVSRSDSARGWYAVYLIWKEHTNANPE